MRKVGAQDRRVSVEVYPSARPLRGSSARGSGAYHSGWPRPLHTPLGLEMDGFSRCIYILDFDDMLSGERGHVRGGGAGGRDIVSFFFYLQALKIHRLTRRVRAQVGSLCRWSTRGGQVLRPSPRVVRRRTVRLHSEGPFQNFWWENWDEAKVKKRSSSQEANQVQKTSIPEWIPFNITLAIKLAPGTGNLTTGTGNWHSTAPRRGGSANVGQLFLQSSECTCVFAFVKREKVLTW